MKAWFKFAALICCISIAHAVLLLFVIRGTFDRLATKNAGQPPRMAYENAMMFSSKVLQFPIGTIAASKVGLPLSIWLLCYGVNSVLWGTVLAVVCRDVFERRAEKLVA